jgi:Flp pilus assembly protein protease CpaA
MKMYLVIFFVAFAVYAVTVYVMRRRVIQYAREKYTNITGLSVCWTLFGPMAPGSGNIKFYVRMSIGNDQYVTFYAITSVFGDIYIHEG